MNLRKFRTDERKYLFTKYTLDTWNFKNPSHREGLQAWIGLSSGDWINSCRMELSLATNYQCLLKYLRLPCGLFKYCIFLVLHAVLDNIWTDEA